jgi:hypothetical protein
VIVPLVRVLGDAVNMANEEVRKDTGSNNYYRLKGKDQL